MHRPAMNRGEALGWVFGWTLGLSALWYFALGFVIGTRGGSTRVGPVLFALVVLTQLLLPGVGVLKPGGARAPVILRSALTFALLWLAGSYGLWSASGGNLVARDAAMSPVSLLALLAMMGAPVMGVPLAYLALVGRGSVRSALLHGGAMLAAGFAVIAPVCDALANRGAQRPMGLAFEVGLGLAFLALITLAVGRARRRAMAPSRWLEGRADGRSLRLGDDLYAAPASLAGYVGPVCAYSPRVGASAPGRGGRPLDPRAVLPCTLAQLQMLRADTQDSSSALALLFATAAALSAALGL